MLCFLTDYDAPVSECGDITEKYKVLRNVLLIVVPESLCKFTLRHQIWHLYLPSFFSSSLSLILSAVYPLPSLPPNLPKEAYGDVKLTLYISLLSTLQYVPVSGPFSNCRRYRNLI